MFSVKLLVFAEPVTYVPNNLHLIILIVIIIIKSIIINCYNSYNMLYVYKYSVHINLLCMLKVRVRWCTCSLWRML